MNHQYLILLTLLLISCSKPHHDIRLESIARKVSIYPHEAIASLNSINPDTLSDSDRHFYDLLSIKATDKAYLAYKSDSLILDVINFYSKRPQDIQLYSEALYYGGRVYYDIGDYPTAIQYFQNALNLLPHKIENLELQSNLLSQTGNLLNQIGLYEQAIPYLKEALRIDSIHKNVYNLTYDNQLLSAIYIHSEQYDSAYLHFQKAIKWMQLLKKKVYNNQLGNLKTIISPQLHKFIPPDSINYHYLVFRDAIEQQYKQYEVVESSIKDTKYNYIKNKRENERTKLLNKTLNEWIRLGMLLIFIIFMLIIAILHIKIKNKNHLLKLYEEIDRIRKVNESVNKDNNPILNSTTDDNINLDINKTISEPSYEKINFTNTHKEQILREELRKEIMQLYEISKELPPVSKVIIESKAYNELKILIEKEKPLIDNNPLWNDLGQVVEKSSNNFKLRLQLLTGGSLKSQDLKIAILIKCGISPTQMASLLGRSKSSITYRRDELCIRIFGQKLGTKVIDHIIRIL